MPFNLWTELKNKRGYYVVGGLSIAGGVIAFGAGASAALIATLAFGIPATTVIIYSVSKNIEVQQKVNEADAANAHHAQDTRTALDQTAVAAQAALDAANGVRQQIANRPAPPLGSQQAIDAKLAEAAVLAAQQMQVRTNVALANLPQPRHSHAVGNSSLLLLKVADFASFALVVFSTYAQGIDNPSDTDKRNAAITGGISTILPFVVHLITASRLAESRDALHDEQKSLHDMRHAASRDRSEAILSQLGSAQALHHITEAELKAELEHVVILERTAEDQKRDHAQIVDELNEQRGALERELRDVNGQIIKVRTNLDQVSQQRDDAQQRLQTADATIRSQADDLGTREQRIQALHGEIGNLSSQRDELEVSLKEHMEFTNQVILAGALHIRPVDQKEIASESHNERLGDHLEIVEEPPTDDEIAATLHQRLHS